MKARESFATRVWLAAGVGDVVRLPAGEIHGRTAVFTTLDRLAETGAWSWPESEHPSRADVVAARDALFTSAPEMFGATPQDLAPVHSPTFGLTPMLNMATKLPGERPFADRGRKPLTHTVTREHYNAVVAQAIARGPQVEPTARERAAEEAARVRAADLYTEQSRERLQQYKADVADGSHGLPGPELPRRPAPKREVPIVEDNLGRKIRIELAR